MDLGTLIVILLGGGGALIAGMAALIKGMVLSRMDRDHGDATASRKEMIGQLDKIQEQIGGLTREHYRLVNRVTTLEAEHKIRTCPKDDR